MYENTKICKTPGLTEVLPEGQSGDLGLPIFVLTLGGSQRASLSLICHLWNEGTRTISQVPLSLELSPRGLLEHNWQEAESLPSSGTQQRDTCYMKMSEARLRIEEGGIRKHILQIHTQPRPGKGEPASRTWAFSIPEQGSSHHAHVLAPTVSLWEAGEKSGWGGGYITWAFVGKFI